MLRPLRENRRIGPSALFWLLTWPIVGAFSCGSSNSPTTNTKHTLGASCQTTADCAPTEFCTDIGNQLSEDWICSKTCNSNDGCQGSYYFDLVCGILADGSRGCIPDCVGRGVACVNGVATACKAADETHCDQCVCSITEHCQVGVGCFPNLAVDERCTSDGECASGNCSTNAGVCRVKVGAPCTTANCDDCYTEASGQTYCTRDCRNGESCGAGFCHNYGTLPGDSHRCFVPCDTGCAACYATTDGLVWCDWR